MKKIISVLLLLMGLCHLQGQNSAKTVLDNAAKTIHNSHGVRIPFSIVYNNNEAIEGDITLQGNRFMIQSKEMSIWFDGTTQWTLNHGSEEVVVNQPSSEELLLISPSQALSMYKKGFKIEQKSPSNSTIAIIELTPKTPTTQNITSYRLYINKKTNQISQIEITDSNKNRTHIKLKPYSKASDVSNKTFVFPEKEFPNIEIIDLR